MNVHLQLPTRKGHYKDYARFIRALIPEGNYRDVFSISEKLGLIFSNKKDKVIYFDLEHNDIVWIFFRSFFSNQNYTIVTSFTSFLNRDFNISKLFKKKELAKVRNALKYFLLKMLIKNQKLKLISIHKGTHFERKIKDISTLITYDIQYYDLNYLKTETEIPNELIDYPFQKKRHVILMFNHTSGEKRNLSELSEFILSTDKYNFLIVGDSSFLGDKRPNNVCSINRYVSNGELIYMMEYADIIYAYYNNNRPSGFMGRGIQLNKYVLVHEDGYLGTIPYHKSISIGHLSKLEQIDISNELDDQNAESYNIFDESLKIKQLILTNGSID